MKRYWLLIILIPFCVLALGTFYVSGSGEIKPDYVLRTIQGQESDGARLQIEGQMDGMPIQVTTKGSESTVDQMSYLEALDTRYYQADMVRLALENRAFMRGKLIDSNAYFENDKVLAYVGTGNIDSQMRQSNTLTISILGKIDDSENSFSVQIEKTSNDIIRVADVQVKDGIMKILATRQQKGDQSRTQVTTDGYEMITVDLTSKSIVKSEQLVASHEQKATTLTDTTYLWEMGKLGPTGYAIFDRTERKRDTADLKAEKREIGLVNRELLVYDIWEGQWRTLQSDGLHKFLMDEDSSKRTSISYKNEEFSLVSISDTTDSHMMLMNIADNKVILDVQLPLQALQKEQGRANFSLLEKDRIHLLMYGSLGPTVATVELSTGKVQYLGVVQEREKLENVQNSRNYLNVNGISLKK